MCTLWKFRFNDSQPPIMKQPFRHSFMSCSQAKRPWKTRFLTCQNTLPGCAGFIFIHQVACYPFSSANHLCLVGIQQIEMDSMQETNGTIMHKFPQIHILDSKVATNVVLNGHKLSEHSFLRWLDVPSISTSVMQMRSIPGPDFLQNSILNA